MYPMLGQGMVTVTSTPLNRYQVPKGMGLQLEPAIQCLSLVLKFALVVSCATEG